MAIYLDHNATSPIRSEVAEAVREAWFTYHGNPASQHASGRAARARLASAREKILALLDADTSHNGDRIIFTSGGTEANNLAILGMAMARTGGAPGRIIVSAIEHPSVLRAAEHLLDLGWRLDTLDVSRDGLINLDSLRAWIGPDVALVSVTLANHETGVIQPVAEVAAICHFHGVPVHTDAVQAIGKIPVSFRLLGVDAMTVTAHKCGGPLGIGALIVRRDQPLLPILFGGEQQDGLRPGTESVALAVGMEVTFELALHELDDTMPRMRSLQAQFEDYLKREIADIVVHGQGAPRLPQTTSLAVRGIDNQLLLAALDAEGIECSIGSACSSGSAEPSATLLAMGVPRDLVRSSLRFSFGPRTTQEELITAASTLADLVRRLRGKRQTPR
ncbi:MAG: cysteine desulfurase family protein [Thermogutta sp.]|nr:cysteine desulfurase family protein [Thermogutta sp.]HPU05101.1 cysteine desulfurase family protein [Thermogutta sp.]HQF15079.1 cysteine desulfurase family protein [Thermogutta sp.]